ncbi:helix-turn-helix domain-containing protein [Streptomyces sp. SID5785]|uniref:helix-turn-helix transcriptional regulator n=1 Tax=Streptomyces sp. SID5785 TaxID=2690309 RepID=UPI001360C4AA|nr:helix-turn-helix transcriptional regulator [Streptomyces sp. SID5785]MZD08141.1 helix-turn-helix domain-containing protein [Streptomyces sp. SID5785]
MTTMTQDVSAGPAEIRRHELAGFLRSRRERITPEEVGLPRGRRRRTPGLRREEVAHLSAVGVTWYTWLEQARDIHVSAQVLDALARTLRLDAGERAHLFGLAGAVDPTPAAVCAPLSPELVALIDQLEPLPACIQNSRYDILAYNSTYRMLLCDLDEIPPADRNWLLLAFTHDAWRSSIVGLDDVLRTLAAKFRSGMADHLAEPAWKLVLKRLTEESAEFRELWERHEVLQSVASKVKHFHNPYVGPLAVVHTDLWLSPAGGARLVTYTPVDAATRARLDELHTLARSSTPQRPADEEPSVPLDR